MSSGHSNTKISEIEARLSSLENDNKILKEDNAIINQRLDRMYNGWKKTKSDLAKINC
jgi:hypothetical protein